MNIIPRNGHLLVLETEMPKAGSFTRVFGSELSCGRVKSVAADAEDGAQWVDATVVFYGSSGTKALMRDCDDEPLQNYLLIRPTSVIASIEE